MSEAAAPHTRASFEGIVTLREMDPPGMITLRGDLASARIQEAVSAVTGLAIPTTRKILLREEQGVAWMSPDEVLLLVAPGAVRDCLERLQKALSGEHALAVDVSDARALFEIRGPAVREIIAKLCPVDMSPGAFEPGDFRRTRMAQVAAALWMVDGERVHVLCFRSVADYVFGLLKDAASPGGEVGYFARPVGP